MLGKSTQERRGPETGLEPLKTLSDTPSTGNPVESLCVARQVFSIHSWVSTSSVAATESDSPPPDKDLPRQVLSSPFYTQRKLRLHGARIYTQYPLAPERSAPSALCGFEEEEAWEEG